MLGKMEIRTPPGSRPRDGRHCDLCGCSQPAVRCDKCGCQIFCLSCDDMYHRHPKRRFHLRKAVDPIPAVPQARPVLPMKVSQLNATNPGDPSKMPLPPPRKKKSLFSSFRKPSPSSENNSPPLPKKEYSWTDRLGSIKKFMSNRPLPPLPLSDDNDTDSPPPTNGQIQKGDLSFIHKRTEERPPQLPQRSPRSPNFPGMVQEQENGIPNSSLQLQGQIRNGSLESNTNHMNQNHELNSNDPSHWNHQMNHQNGTQAFGTLNRQRQFMPPGAPGYPGGMHQSSSATDLHNLHNTDGMQGHVPPHYPHYPVNPHMPPHYPYPVYPGYPNYPNYFGNSFANLSNPPTSEGDFSDSESSSRHSSKRQQFRRRAKRSQSVMMDRMAYPGQFFPFGPYPGYGPWGAPMPMETPPSPASSVRSLNRTGRTRRRKKGTSEDEDEELSEASSPMSRPKSSSSDPKENPRAPLATQTTSSEDESEDNADKRRHKINTIRRQSEPLRSPSPAITNKKIAKLRKSSSKQSDSDTQENPAIRNDRRPSDTTTEQQQTVRQSPIQQQPVEKQQVVRQSPVQQHSNVQRSPTPQRIPLRESPVKQSAPVQPNTSHYTSSSETWECRHCTFVNPSGNRICQVCCKTATPRTETPVSNQSRPSSSAAKNRKGSVSSDNEYYVPDEKIENDDASKKEKQDMASLNSALDEAEKQISKGLEELMKLKDDMDSNTSREKSKSSETETKSDIDSKPVYKSSGRMRTSILDKLSLNKSQPANSSVSTSTETQTDQNSRTIDKIIEARRLSNSSSASETYNSPLAQSPELCLGNKQKRDSSCQTQQDSIADYLEKRKAAEEAYLGRPINNFGFGYNDRMDMMTSPVPSMYDRFYGGGYGMMQRSHSRASLFTGRVNDFGPMEYGPGFGFGGPTPMYRSVSRGSLTGDYPDGRMSEFHNLRKPDYYLSMEELVERRRQDNIRAQGLELVRMIREAEQQGFNADDIQVALTHCGKQNPLEWLQDNWRNMVDSVVTLSTNYGNDKKENDIGLLSENEARDALRLHKGNIWAAVTECVEGRQRKYLEISAKGNFSRQDIVDALTSVDGDVEMAYTKLTKSVGKPFLMRIWGQGEGVQNQDGAQPMSDDFMNESRRYLKDETLNNEYLSDDIWSEDEDAVDWEDDEEYDEERGDIEDLRTCQEDLSMIPQDITTPESEKSDYCDAFSIDDRNASSPSDDIFFVIPESKPEKKRGFLSKLVALRRNSKEQAESTNKETVTLQQDPQPKEDSTYQKSVPSPEQKNAGALNTLKNKFSAIKETVTGGVKTDKKVPVAQPERRTIIVKGQLEHESLSANDEDETKLDSIPNTLKENDFKTLKTDVLNQQQINSNEGSVSTEFAESTNIDNNKVKNLTENSHIIADKKEVEVEVKKADSKKSDNKYPQSLAGKLKLVKQAQFSIDAPGPSGINKSMNSSVMKENAFIESKKEPIFQENKNLKSEITLEKERSTDKLKVNETPNIRNYEQPVKFVPKESEIAKNNTHDAKIPSNNNQSTVDPVVNKTSHVKCEDLTKKSNAAISNEPSEINTLTNNLPNSDTSQIKEERTPEIIVQHSINKKSPIEIESKINLKESILSNVEIAKSNDKPSSVLKSKSKEDVNNEGKISKVAQHINVSKDNVSSINDSLLEKSAAVELKANDYQNTKSESIDIHSKEISSEVPMTENKTSTVKNKDEKERKIQEEFKAGIDEVKPIKEDTKIIQHSDNKTVNIKSSDIPKVTEDLKNSVPVSKKEANKKSQKSLIVKNNSETKSLNKGESSGVEDKVVHQNITSREILKTEEISEIPSDKLPNYDEHKDGVSTNDEKSLVDSNESKLEILEHDIQNNITSLQALSESDSITQTKTSPHLSTTSSNACQENMTAQILNNSDETLKLENDIVEVKSLSGEASTKAINHNETNKIESVEIVNKVTASTSSKKEENLSQMNTQVPEKAQSTEVENSSIKNSVSEKLPIPAQINPSIIPHENNKVSEDKMPIKVKNETSHEPTAIVTANLIPSDNSLSDTASNSANETRNDTDTLIKSTDNQNKEEFPQKEEILNEKEISAANISSKKELKPKVKSPDNNKQISSEDELTTANTNLENASHTLAETSQNISLPIENQNLLASVTVTTSTSKENNIPDNVSENAKEQSQEPITSYPKDTKINSSEIINNKLIKETELQAPVFSKEFPNKTVSETPGAPGASSKNSEVVVNSEPFDSELLPTTSSTNTSDSIKISENESSPNTLDSDKTIKASLITNNTDKSIASNKTATNKVEVSEKSENVSDDSKIAINANIPNSSTIEENSINDKIIDSSSKEQDSSVISTNTTSVLEENSVSKITTNDSVKEKSPISTTDVATASSSSNTITTDSSEKTNLPTSTGDSSISDTKEVSERLKLSSDNKSESNDTKTLDSNTNEQHSNEVKTLTANSSVESNSSTSSADTANSSSTRATTLVESKKLQRSISEESRDSNTSDSDDTDIEYSSSSSRRGSLLLPSPVDTLRSRFEGFSSGTTARGEPVRPASPFRRMSFNSRRQVIALERKRDTSNEKPWYHKVAPEPVKVVQPKRSVKQQLEMERKVRKMVADRKCRTYKKAEIVVQLMDMNFEEEEAIQAANECSTLEQSISYLQQECLLCAGHFPVSQIVSMTHCQHRACRECIRAYFTVQIRDRTILDLLCPFCNEPDIGDEDVAQDYFNHLDIMLKKLVDIEIHELFQRKLRDRVLMKDPNFRWCSQCSSGFIAMPNLKRLICPDCNAVTCASCRRLWEKEHQGISCEAFAAMKDATDPETQAAGLAKMLTEDGIACPSCHFRYALAKGGCMHFRCIQCQHDFCSGCSRPFKMGQKCGVSEFCAKLGLHAHHPRNCLFYLRDKDPEDLQKLLDMSDVKYNREPPDITELKTTCQVMEQKETADGMVDDICGKEVQDGYAGLCRIHYVEYLGQLVNKFKVDPIQIFDNDDLELVLKRANVRLPPRRYRENEAQYREKLIKVIQEELPLDKMDGS